MELKTFIQALEVFPQDTNKFRKYLNDKRLTLIERKILHGWMTLREGKFSRVIQELDSMATINDIILSQKEALVGVALNNNGDPLSAVPRLLKAKQLLENYDLPYQKFMVQSNLFVAYHNLKNGDEMKKALAELEETKNQTQAQKIRILRYRCNYFGFMGDTAKAIQLIKELEILVQQMSESQKSGVLIDQFMFYIKLDDFEKCEKILEKMKQHRTYKLTANYQFMKKLLKFVVNGGALYLYSNDFVEHPILFHQVNVLLALEKGDRKQAAESWECLSKFAPYVYREGFKYDGDKCLFSMALEKVLPRQAATKPVFTSDSHEEVLLEILRLEGGRAIPKEELFLRVYGRESASKDDFNKLACIVYRIKSKHGLNIKSKKGCYQFVATLPLKKSA